MIFLIEIYLFRFVFLVYKFCFKICYTFSKDKLYIKCYEYIFIINIYS